MSRYPSPGTLVLAQWEDDQCRWIEAQVAVMSTSRHRRSIDEPAALELLRAQHGPDAQIKRIAMWRSVTQGDLDHGGLPDRADLGGWWEDASGSAFVVVAYPDTFDNAPTREAS